MVLAVKYVKIFTADSLWQNPQPDQTGEAVVANVTVVGEVFI